MEVIIDWGADAYFIGYTNFRRLTEIVPLT